MYTAMVLFTELLASRSYLRFSWSKLQQLRKLVWVGQCVPHWLGSRFVHSSAIGRPHPQCSHPLGLHDIVLSLESGGVVKPKL
jgi:hypothetical protein